MKKKNKLDENGEPIDELEDVDVGSEEEVLEEQELDYDAMDSSDSTEETI